MAVKYRIEYDDIKDIITRIDISNDEYIGSVIQLTADANPLEINLPEGDDIFDPVQGSGGTIRVLAKDSDNLRSLYTSDPMKYLVTIYKGGTSSSNIIFVGYVNTNFYSEPFNEYDSYSVSISFNDRLAVLSKIKYLNSGAAYTGIVSISILLLRTLGKINDIYKDIRIVSDMNYDGYTISNDSILHKLSVINDNYYDEGGEPKSYREVLEGVFKGLGLICFTQNASLWIVDPIMIQNASYSVRVFNPTSAVYESSYSISPNKGIGVTVDFWQTGTQLDFIPSYSKLSLNYSGYASTDLTETGNWQDLDLHSADGSWVWTPDSGDSYYENNSWGGIDGWTISNGAEWYGTYLNEGEEEYHARWGRTVPTGGGDGLLKLAFSGGHRIHYVPNQFLKINLSMYTQTVNGYYNSPNSVTTKGKLFGIYQRMKIRIGDDYWNGSSWTTTSSDFWVQLRGEGRVDNRWTDYTIGIPLSSGVNGTVNIYFYDESDGLDESWSTWSDSPMVWHRIKDVSTSVTDSAANLLSFDLEYESDLDSTWADEADKIEVIHGDSSVGVASHRGGYLSSNTYGYATDFRYGSMSTYKHLSNVILKKYQSQYQNSRMVLTTNLTCPNIYTDGLAKTGNISDNVNLSGKKFFLREGTYYDRDRYISGVWVELLTDDITIS